MNDNSALPELLTVAEVAASLRTDVSNVYRHIRAGHLAAVRFGGSVRVPVTALDDFLVPTTPSTALGKTTLDLG